MPTRSSSTRRRRPAGPSSSSSAGSAQFQKINVNMLVQFLRFALMLSVVYLGCRNRGKNTILNYKIQTTRQRTTFDGGLFRLQK